MKFIILFIIFCFSYFIFDWIIKRTDINNKLLSKCKMKKHIKTVWILLFVSLAFSIEYGKQLLENIYGNHSYTSIIVCALLSSIYMNFVPLIFKRDK